MTTRNDRAAAISHPVPAADTLDFWADELASVSQKNTVIDRQVS
jgi:hypothetical protein